MENRECIVAVDNGVSGTIATIRGRNITFLKTPVFSQQNYTKKKGNITRIDTDKLKIILKRYEAWNPLVVLEIPMVNPKRLLATFSALRAFEATLIMVEQLNYTIIYMSSKEWQDVMLPTGTKGSLALKKASKDIGCRLFPKHRDLIIKHKDADSLLMMEYSRRKNL